MRQYAMSHDIEKVNSIAQHKKEDKNMAIYGELSRESQNDEDIEDGISIIPRILVM